MEKWAAQELQYAELGDTRRNKRLTVLWKTWPGNQGRVLP
jgi:hypothetical protein